LLWVALPSQNEFVESPLPCFPCTTWPMSFSWHFIAF
jgi:hypothetical protein